MKSFMELLFSLSFSEWMLMIQTTIMIIECRIRIIEFKRKNAVIRSKDHRRLSVHSFPSMKRQLMTGTAFSCGPALIVYVILELFQGLLLIFTIFSNYSPRSEGKENRISLKLPVDSVTIRNSGCSRGFPRYSVFVSLPFEAHSARPSYAFLFLPSQ